MVRKTIRSQADGDDSCDSSQSRTIREMAEFWDTHDATDYDDQTQKVAIEFDLETRHHYIAVDPELLARARGISLESLVNLWLQERALVSES